MEERDDVRGEAAVTIPGAGGQVPPRPDQGYAGASQAVVSPGSGAGIVRARQVIVAGPGEGVFSYSSSPPAFGTLISTAGIATAGTDPYSNAYLAGTTTYLPGATYFATSLNGGFVSFYTAPGAGGPWTLQGQILISAGGTLILNFTNLSGAVNNRQPAISGLPLASPAPAGYGSVWGTQVVNAINAIYANLQAANIQQ
jgi:hypothetical protein